MRVETLKSPGLLSSGLQLRTQAAKAISSVEQFPTAVTVQSLTDFFTDCAVKAGGTVTPTLPATQAIVANAGTVAVKNSVGTTVDAAAVATVAANAVTGIALAATKAVIDNAAANVVVQNSAGAAVTSAGVAAVAAGVLSNVKLPATIAAVANAVKVNVASVSGTGNFATFTVANGVITAIVLSTS